MRLARNMACDLHSWFVMVTRGSVLSLLLALGCGEIEIETLAQDQSSAGLVPVTEIVSRSGWSARDVDPTRDGECSRRSYPAIITVHHTDAPQHLDGFATSVQIIQNEHMSGNHWCDIGYHVLIGEDGELIRGRPDERLLGIHTSPAHRPGFESVRAGNSGNLGVALLGDFDSDQPSNAQLAGLARFLAWAHRVYGIPLDRETIRPHGERNGTFCPGQHFVDVDSRTGTDLLPAVIDCARAIRGGQGALCHGLGSQVEPPAFAQPDVALSLDQPPAGGELLLSLSSVSSQPLQEVVLRYQFDGLTVGSWQGSGGAPVPVDRSTSGTIVLTDLEPGAALQWNAVVTRTAAGARFGGRAKVWVQRILDASGNVRYGDQLEFVLLSTYERQVADGTPPTAWTRSLENCDSDDPERWDSDCPAAPINAYGLPVQVSAQVEAPSSR